MLQPVTVAFLDALLPTDGLYIATIFDPKPRHVVCDTIEGLANVLLEADSRGATVYHACASYRERAGVVDAKGVRHLRSQANVLAAGSLWLDVDAGVGKPYATAADAARAVLAFCAVAELDRPSFVGSGSGLHCYWFLEQPLAPEQWRAYAAALKAGCTHYGLAADPARTTDIASILRPPGSHHRKHGERLVEWDGRTDFADVGRIGRLHQQFGGAQPVPRSDTSNHGIVGRILAGNSFAAAFADNIADQCGQLAALRASGNCAEPTWHARLGVLAFCEDGDDVAHAWSANDFPGYSEVETQQKLERLRQMSGATTCARLNDVCAGICTSCKSWGKILSPISLGYAKVEPIAAKVEPPPAGEVGGRALPKLPEMFAWSEHKLVMKTEDKDHQPIYDVICDQPIFLDSVQTAELNNSTYSYKFSKWLPHGGWQEVYINAAEMHGSAGISEMFGMGVVIHQPKMFLQYVRAQVDEFHSKFENATRFDQFGWKNDDTAFLFGDKLYTEAGPISSVGGPEVIARSQYLGPTPKGNLHAWTEAIDNLFGSDMEAISATVLASFAAPLMRFHSGDEGGAILHLYTPGSGQGKTTALTGAWTVWGVKNGLNLTNDDTKVSKPIAMGTLANLPVIYDELRNKDPEVIRQLVMMFTDGRDRMRAQVDGTLRHTKSNWQTVVISAANNPLVDQLSNDGTDAPAFRVLEVAANLPKNVDAALGDQLKRVLAANAGHAGDAYLRYLLQPDVLPWAKQAMEDWTRQIWALTGNIPAQRYRVRLVAGIAVGGALALRAGLVHFAVDRIVHWLIDQIKDDISVVNLSTVTGVDPAQLAINALGEFINDHKGECLIVNDKYKPRDKVHPLQEPNNKLTVRYEINPAKVYIAMSAFRDWALKKGMSPRTMIQLLAKNNVLHDYKRMITLSAGTNIPGAQVPCLEIDAAHPAMSGIVAAAEVLQIRQSTFDRRPDQSVEALSAASQPPR